jgi:putative transposase
LQRIPEGKNKQALLFAIAKARRVLPLASVIKVLHLSAARYHAWARAQTTCELDDHRSCPLTTPQKLTARELMRMKDMVLSPDHRHMSIRALALHAQRMGEIIAHPVTWYKTIRERGWIQPRFREYPECPKEGIRATKPNEAWHVARPSSSCSTAPRPTCTPSSTTYSRRILSWTVAETMTPSSTYAVLVDAAKHLPITATTVVMDKGGENVNKTVDPLFDGEKMKRVLALVNVSYSNSMIEAWWRSLRHRWLYLHQLDSVATIRRLTAFYVHQHNTVMPHAAFDGQTPDEVYFARGERVPDELRVRRIEARQRRLAENRRTQCGACPRASPEAEVAA